MQNGTVYVLNEGVGTLFNKLKEFVSRRNKHKEEAKESPKVYEFHKKDVDPAILKEVEREFDSFSKEVREFVNKSQYKDKINLDTEMNDSFDMIYDEYDAKLFVHVLSVKEFDLDANDLGRAGNIFLNEIYHPLEKISKKYKYMKIDDDYDKHDCDIFLHCKLPTQSKLHESVTVESNRVTVINESTNTEEYIFW